MMTQYTSFIAVTENIRNQDGKSTDVDQPLPLPANVSNLAVGGAYLTGSEPGTAFLLLGAMAIMAFGAFRRRKAFKWVQR